MQSITLQQKIRRKPFPEHPSYPQLLGLTRKMKTLLHRQDVVTVLTTWSNNVSFDPFCHGSRKRRTAFQCQYIQCKILALCHITNWMGCKKTSRLVLITISVIRSLLSTLAYVTWTVKISHSHIPEFQLVSFVSSPKPDGKLIKWMAWLSMKGYLDMISNFQDVLITLGVKFMQTLTWAGGTEWSKVWKYERRSSSNRCAENDKDLKLCCVQTFNT